MVVQQIAPPLPQSGQIPSSVGYERIWLDGLILPVFQTEQEDNLAVPDGKFTLGDYTKDSDRYLSGAIIGDLTAGAMALKMSGPTAQAYLDGLIEGTFPNMITLAPMVDPFPSPVTLTPGQNFTPIGTLGLSFYGCFGTKFVRFNDTGLGTGSYVSTADITAPVNVGVVWNAKLYIPVDTGYYIWDGATMSALQTTALAREFQSFDNNLWVLTSDGKVGFSINGTTWTFDTAMIIRDEIPYHMKVFTNTAQQPALVVNTDRSIWYVDPLTPAMRKTKVWWPADPRFGRGAEVWRSGENLLVAQGMGVLRYDGESSIPGIGLDKGAGVPASLRGSIIDMYGAYNELWALVLGESNTTQTLKNYFSEMSFLDRSGVFSANVATSSLWKFTGNGWHRQWVSPTTAEVPTKLCLDTANNAFRLVWGSGGIAYHMDLRKGWYNPQDGLEQGLDRFQETSFFYTGRFYAETEGMIKLASHLPTLTKFCSPTETITISYQTDDSAGFIPLAVISGNNRYPVRFRVDAETGFSRGKPCEWVQLRYDLRRQSTVGMSAADKLAAERKSPILDSSVLKFFKLPEPTTAHTVQIICPEEGFNGVGPDVIREFLDSRAGPGPFYPAVIGHRVYRARISKMLGSQNVGPQRAFRRQITLLDVPDGTAQEFEGIVQKAELDGLFQVTD